MLQVALSGLGSENTPMAAARFTWQDLPLAPRLTLLTPAPPRHRCTPARAQAQGHASPRVGGPGTDLPGNDELPQWHGGPVLRRDPLQGGDGLFLVPRQHVIPGALRQPLRAQESHAGSGLGGDRTLAFSLPLLCVQGGTFRVGLRSRKAGWPQSLALPLSVPAV